jgi:transposase-like protein
MGFSGQSISFLKEQEGRSDGSDKGKHIARGRRRFAEEFKREAAQMQFDGHEAPAVAERLGLSGPKLVYRWKQAAVERAGPAVRTLGDRVAQLEDELRRVERDILKKALAILRSHT